MKTDKKIILLCSAALSTNFVYNGISKEFEISKVIQEDSIAWKKLLKNRAKRIGYFKVFGQILFGVLLLPLLRKSAKKRRAALIQEFKLNNKNIPENKIIRVPSVNSKKCIELLKQEKPDLVIVNGTRIISTKVLNATEAIFLNTHEGINPKYRGIHGGYWALYNQDPENFGVTVHLVDKGVDTGNIVYQSFASPTKKDSFPVYPLYQTSEGIKILKKAVGDFFRGDLKTRPIEGENRIWYHPTIWQYLYARIFKGVK